MGRRLRTSRFSFPGRWEAFFRHHRETARRAMLLGINKLLEGIVPYSTERGTGPRHSHHPKELECGRRLASAGTQASFSRCRLQCEKHSEMNKQSRNVARNQQHPFLRDVLSIAKKPVDGRPVYGKRTAPRSRVCCFQRAGAERTAAVALHALYRLLPTGRLGRGRNKAGMSLEINRLAASPLHQGLRRKGDDHRYAAGGWDSPFRIQNSRFRIQDSETHPTKGCPLMSDAERQVDRQKWTIQGRNVTGEGERPKPRCPMESTDTKITFLSPRSGPRGG